MAAQEALVAGALSKNALIKDEREADNALIMHQMDTAKAMLASAEPVIRMLHAPGHVAVADHKLDIPPESVAPLGHQAAPTADTEVEQGTTTSANCNLSAEYAHMPAQLEQMYSTDHDGLVISHEGIIDVKPAPTADGEIVESEQGAADPHLVGTMTANANAPTSAEFAQLQADHEQMKLMFLQMQAQLMEYQPLITSTNDISGIHDSSIVLPTLTTAAGSSGEIQSSSSNEETGIGKTPTPLALNLPELSSVEGTCMPVRVYYLSVAHQRRSNVQACFI
eukprot:COSAG06_NODE_7071_length_2647_cov_2.169152_2_plen_280_part_00